MRWFVEISNVGKKAGKATKLCVEANQWQPALQRARSIRGDDGPLSNFSIELLDDGYRAIDPRARLKYVVRRAPDDATLSNGGAASVAPPPASVPPPASTRPAPAATEKASPPPVAIEPPKSPSPAVASPPSTEKSPISGRSFASKSEASPRSTRMFASPGAAAIAAPQTKPSAGGAVHVEAKPLREIPLDKPPPPPAAPGLPKYTVLSERDEEPTAKSPLHYREVVYVVQATTPIGEVERLLRDRFADMKRSLSSKRSGKLVNLAAFDHAYDGAPKRPPVMTLSWRDWRGDDPEVRRPGDGAETPTPLASASALAKLDAPKPAPAPAAKVETKPKAEPAPPPPAAKVEPKPEPAAKVEAKPEPAPAAKVEAKPEPAPATAPKAEPKPRSEPPTKSATSQSGPMISVREPSPASMDHILAVTAEQLEAAALEAAPISEPPPPSPLPGPKTIIDAPPEIEVREAPSTPAPAPASFPTPSILPPTPSYIPPAPKQPVASQPPPPAPPQNKRKKRISGDDLISELFEAMSDLHFLGDALQGAEFVLTTSLDKIPSEVGLVSLFDINKREFVVVRQRGGPRSVLGFRQPEKSPVALSAMRSKAAVMHDGDGAQRAVDDRVRAIGVDLSSVLCAPIALGGRYLGIIELFNSSDGGYRDADCNALTYVGQQYGEFVAERGVVIDAEQILESAKAAAARAK